MNHTAEPLRFDRTQVKNHWLSFSIILIISESNFSVCFVLHVFVEKFYSYDFFSFIPVAGFYEIKSSFWQQVGEIITQQNICSFVSFFFSLVWFDQAATLAPADLKKLRAQQRKAAKRAEQEKQEKLQQEKREQQLQQVRITAVLCFFQHGCSWLTFSFSSVIPFSRRYSSSEIVCCLKRKMVTFF